MQPKEKPPVGFWRHVPWAFVAAFCVSAVVVGLVSSYYDVYGGAVLVLWGSVISASFQESRRLERQRITDGDPHPARPSRTNLLEILVSVALILFSGALVVFVSYINLGSDDRVPTTAEGLGAGLATLISASTITGVFLKARRQKAKRLAS